MDREILIKKTMKNIFLLPDWRLKEVSEYINFLIKKKDNEELLKGINKLTSTSKSFQFLEDEEELYDDSDLIRKY